MENSRSNHIFDSWQSTDSSSTSVKHIYGTYLPPPSLSPLLFLLTGTWGRSFLTNPSFDLYLYVDRSRTGHFFKRLFDTDMEIFVTLHMWFNYENTEKRLKYRIQFFEVCEKWWGTGVYMYILSPSTCDFVMNICWFFSCFNDKGCCFF